MSEQTDSGVTRRAFTTQWLIGTALFLAALFTLFLMLGWFAYFEMLAIGVGALAMGGVFVLFALANPGIRWPLVAGYLLLSVGIMLGVGFLLDYDFTVVLATGVGLLGLPFLWLYVDRVWLRTEIGFWWAGLIAGIMVTLGVSLLHFRAGWPPHLLRGLITFTFMGGAAASAFMVWAPSWRDERARWLVLVTVVTTLIAFVGILDVIDMEFLIPVALLMLGSAFFLVRGVVTQAQYERERTAPRSLAAAQPVDIPGPVTLEPLPLQTGLRPSPSLPIPGQTVQPTPTEDEPPPPAEATEPSPDDTQPVRATASTAATTPQVRPEPPAATQTTTPPPQAINLGNPLQLADINAPSLTPSINLTSPDFKNGSAIPLKYSAAREGHPYSPPLKWENLPPNTQTLALILDTPDAPEGIRTHWVICNLPGHLEGLPPGVPVDSSYAGGVQMPNDFGVQGYSGPVGERAPGEPFRYFFKIYALDTALTIPPVADRPLARRDLTEAMRGHILATGQLMGLYPVRPDTLPD